MLQWHSRWESDAAVLEFFTIGRMAGAFLSRPVKGGGRWWEVKLFRFIILHMTVMGGYGESRGCLSLWETCFWKNIIAKGVKKSAE